MASKPKNIVSSPKKSPVYGPGAVMAVRPENTIADYQKRFERDYKTNKKKLVPPVTPKIDTGVDTANKEYQALMDKYKGDLAKQRDAAAQLFNKNRGALETDRNTSREALTKQRGYDLDDIAQNYAARGIGRTSGIYQQAGKDYETSFADRIKNTEESFTKQLKQEEGTQKETVTEADTEYNEGMAAAAERKAAAIEDAKAEAAPTPKAKTLPTPIPKAKPRPTPKYKTVTKKRPRLMDGG